MVFEKRISLSATKPYYKGLLLSNLSCSGVVTPISLGDLAFKILAWPKNKVGEAVKKKIAMSCFMISLICQFYSYWGCFWNLNRHTSCTNSNVVNDHNRITRSRVNGRLSLCIQSITGNTNG